MMTSSPGFKMPVRVERLGGPHGDQHLLRACSSAPVGFKFRNGPAQGGRALVGGVVGLVLPQGKHRRLLDGLRGGQIRLPNGKPTAIRGLPRQIGKQADAAALQGV